MNIAKNIFLSAVFFICFKFVNAQYSLKSIDKFEESRLRFYMKYLTVKPSTDNAYGGITLNLSWHKNYADKRKKRFMWEETLFSDVVAYVVKKHIMKRPITKSGLDHSFSSGIFGSFQYGFNAFVSDKFIVSPCLSFGDYIVGIHRFEDHNLLTAEEKSQIILHSVPNTTYRDPAGYFFVAGPSVIISYLPPVKNFWIDAFSMYDFTVYNVGEKNMINFIHKEGYPNPHFVSFGFNINHSSGLFFGTRIYSLINRGDNDGGIHRFDFNIGFNL